MKPRPALRGGCPEALARRAPPRAAGRRVEGLRRDHRADPARPAVRPDAEATANRLGATLADLRAAIEDVGCVRAGRDARLSLVPGTTLLRPDQLPDGIHPGDEGHAVLADAVGPLIAAAAAGRGD